MTTATKSQRKVFEQIKIDPILFRRVINIDADCWAVGVSDLIEPWQESDFRALAAGCLGRSVANPLDEVRPAPTSREFDQARVICELWECFFLRNP